MEQKNVSNDNTNPEKPGERVVNDGQRRYYTPPVTPQHQAYYPPQQQQQTYYDRYSYPTQQRRQQAQASVSTARNFENYGYRYYQPPVYGPVFNIDIEDSSRVPEDFKNGSIERKIDILGNVYFQILQLMEGNQSQMNYRLSSYDSSLQSLDYNLGQLFGRFDHLSFTQNSRIAKGLRFGVQNIVEKMIKRDLKKQADFTPLTVRQEDETFRNPRECAKHLTPEFREMRNHMNSLQGTNRLDKRKHKFLRIPGDQVSFPAIHVGEDDGSIMMFRFTTSPIECLFDKTYRRRGRKINTFVKNLFYNMSVLEQQVSVIKDIEKIELVVFVYESMRHMASVYDFLRYYPNEFKFMNVIVNSRKFKVFSLKDVNAGVKIE